MIEFKQFQVFGSIVTHEIQIEVQVKEEVEVTRPLEHEQPPIALSRSPPSNPISVSGSKEIEVEGAEAKVQVERQQEEEQEIQVCYDF